jgi:two-component system, OmpR family, sensor histidine kinase VicK
MIKFLTDIRNENLEYCKSMLEEIKHLEMRHMDGAKGNFAIHDDKEYFLPFFVDTPGEPVSNLLLFCMQKEMVEARGLSLKIFGVKQHQLIFGLKS